MARRLAILLPAYLLVSALCYWGAFLLRLDFDLREPHREIFFRSLPVVMAVKLLVFQISREWQRDSRYYALRDVTTFVALNVVLGLVLLALNAAGVLGGPSPVPRSVILIDAVLQVMLFGMVRVAPRFCQEILAPAIWRRSRLRTVIYSERSEGADILKSLQSSNHNFDVIGFISPRHEFASRVAGIPVYRPDEGFRALVERLGARRVLISSTVSRRTIREITSGCVGLDTAVHVIPGVSDIAAGRHSLGIRDVTAAELLGRKPATLDTREIASYIAGRSVLVTGAAGSIGSELCRQLLQYRPASLVVVDQSELGIFSLGQEFEERSAPRTDVHPLIADVTDRQWLEQVLARHRPQVIFHAAAYKHVPLMEKNVQAAVRNNVLGTKILADLAVEFDVERLLLVSTDKAVRPKSVMGATKFLAERYVQAVGQSARTDFITVRFGNVLNSTGSLIPTFRRQIQRGGPVTVTHPDMRRFFMTIPEASQLVLQAGAMGQSGDVFILEMGEPIRILDLAKDMIRLSGQRYPEDIDIVFTGVRPGEKLQEELFYNSERGVKVHEKIFRVRPENEDIALVRADLARLASTLPETPEETSNVLWQIVAQCVEKRKPRQYFNAAA